MIRRICVFCGSSPGARPAYREAATQLGHALARTGIGLVYGGASVGLMGQLARAVLDHGGQVTGVIPRDLLRAEVALTELADLRVVSSMHERKALMADLADGFIALPGGLGTIEEFFEAFTWAQLGLHRKPCGLLNVCHYYDGLLQFLDTAVAEQFIRGGHRSMLLVDERPEALLAQFVQYVPPRVDKAAWILGMSGKRLKR